MVNQADTPENTEATGDAPIDNSVGTTTDITEEFAGVNTFEDTPTPSVDDLTSEDTNTAEQAESSPTATTESEAISPASDSDTPVPPVDAPPQAQPQNDVGQRLAQLEQQNAQYQRSQYDAALNQNYEKYKSDLENAGYMPDQAEFVARNWLNQVSEQARVQQQQQEVVEYVQGQAIAAEVIAQKYNLSLNDLGKLRQHRDPQSMEAAAKQIASDRGKDAEIARLRAQLVPNQSFNDNQSTPAASNDEDRWLEKYNQGDRSPQAESAARKAAGLG